LRVNAIYSRHLNDRINDYKIIQLIFGIHEFGQRRHHRGGDLTSVFTTLAFLCVFPLYHCTDNESEAWSPLHRQRLQRWSESGDPNWPTEV